MTQCAKNSTFLIGKKNRVLCKSRLAQEGRDKIFLPQTVLIAELEGMESDPLQGKPLSP